MTLTGSLALTLKHLKFHEKSYEMFLKSFIFIHRKVVAFLAEGQENSKIYHSWQPIIKHSHFSNFFRLY